MPAIHNIFLDHLDNPDGLHHHHGAGDNDILWHKHDNPHNEYRSHDYENSFDYFGPADHNHPPADDNDTGFDGYDDDAWANNIDNLTGGDPYQYLSTTDT